MDPAELDRLQRVVGHEITGRFPAGAVRRVTVLQHGDDPAIEPGDLLVRVFIPAPGRPEEYAGFLAAWQDTHGSRMARLRRELSMRLPPARVLEFTLDGTGFSAPAITMRDDGTERVSVPDIVAGALALLRENYVFPDRAGRAAAAVRERLAAGEYAGLDEITLCDRLTAHLREVCADRHLRVTLDSPPLPTDRRDTYPGGPGRGRAGAGAAPDADQAAWRSMGRLDNYGIHRAERLPGNVGLIELRRVAMAANAGLAISAAMELVGGTEALIFDLRRNGGGAPDGVVLWCSYLFPDGRTHLNDIFDAGTGETRQYWSLPYVPGARYLDRPVYVLCSARTFSGGEDFCYTLQAQGRAEVIGETTGGGAHPTRRFQVTPAVAISVPFARSVNPVTGTNWEGTGVTPDVAVPEAEAFGVAYGRALRHVLSADLPAPLLDEAREALAGLPPSGSGPD